MCWGSGMHVWPSVHYERLRKPEVVPFLSDCHCAHSGNLPVCVRCIKTAAAGLPELVSCLSVPPCTCSLELAVCTCPVMTAAVLSLSPPYLSAPPLCPFREPAGLHMLHR